MKDKFAEYYSTEERVKELSQYVHENFKIIQTKMISEMRRKLDIAPDYQNRDGYVSLMVSLYGRMFNEMVYGLAGFCNNPGIDGTQIISIHTIDILITLLKGESPLNGKIRTDVKNNPEAFKKMYLDCIEELREVKEGLPK